MAINGPTEIANDGQERGDIEESARFRFNSAILIEDSLPCLGTFGSVIALNELGNPDLLDWRRKFASATLWPTKPQLSRCELTTHSRFF